MLYKIYDRWKTELDSYDTVIMDSRRASKYAVQWIKRKYPNKRVIVWYWNQVSRVELDPEFCKKNGCEVWSFDRADCERYQMRFNDQYLLACDKGFSDEIKTDLLYVGGWSEKREHQLKKLESEFENINFKYHLAHNKEEWIPYKKYISQIKESRGILELNKAGQSGLTLRTLEALFYKKKLVTNNLDIVNEKIYIPDNIFIIGNENNKSVQEFLSEPYVMDDRYEELVSYYGFDAWVKRICGFSVR